MNDIYFDHAATTAMSAEVLQAYVSAATGGPSNPSSLHAHGRTARERVAVARDLFAALLQCAGSELVFVGSGTESDNSALFGAACAQRMRGRSGIVTTAIEHHAVLNACRQLEAQGFSLTVLPVNERGSVDAEEARAAIDETTAVVSVMAGNNETGALQPIAEIGAIARQHGALMHVDAIQAFGYMPINLRELPIDLLSLSAHKIYGPQGVGLLYIRKGTPFQPLMYGGAQERNRRAGTENVAGIAAFAQAAQAACQQLEERRNHAEKIRVAVLDQLSDRFDAAQWEINGQTDPARRLPHILNLSFKGISTETLLMNLDLAGISVSGGSACTSGSLKPSHVLTAMKLNDERMKSAVRLSFGLGNTIEEAEKFAKITATILARVRNR